MSSDRERIIEFDAATTIPADGWFAIDSTTEGTRKVQKSAIIGSGTLDTTSQEVVGAINEVNARAATVESMTQAEYDALPDTKLSDNVVRYITDGEPTYDETLWNKVGEDPLDTTAQDCSGAINEIKSALSQLTNFEVGEWNTGMKWIDGKDIYCKLVSTTTGSTSPSTDTIYLPSNVSTVIYKTFRLEYNTSGGVYFDNTFWTSNDFVVCWLSNYNELKFRTTYLNRPYQLWVFYTKS